MILRTVILPCSGASDGVKSCVTIVSATILRRYAEKR